MRSALITARLALALLGLAAMAALAAVAGVRLGLIPYGTGRSVMVLATVLGLAALAASLFWLLSALKHNSGVGKRVGLIAFCGSVALLYSPLQAFIQDQTTPPLNDVSTDPNDAPQFVTLAARAPGMNPAAFDGQMQIRYHGQTNTVSYMLHTWYPKITKPNAAFVTPTKAFWRAFEAVKRMGWTIVAYSEKDGRIEATDTSFWFGEPADIVVRIKPAGTEGARLDVRAQSLWDRRDFTANENRILNLLKQINR
jgi:hypothetical protein